MDLRERPAAAFHRHPWELSRADNILKFIVPLAPDAACADIGAGDLYIAQRLRGLTSGRLVVVDRAFSSIELHGGIERRLSMTDLLPGSMDVVLLLDVLEHVPEDAAFLAQAVALLKTGGVLLITVPAHPFLFSEHDRFLKHFRRYSAAALRQLIAMPQLHVSEVFSFYGAAFWARSLTCLIERLWKPGRAKGVGNWRWPERQALTRVARAFLNVDFALMRWISRTPFPLPGLSLCAICRKK